MSSLPAATRIIVPASEIVEVTSRVSQIHTPQAVDGPLSQSYPHHRRFPRNLQIQYQFRITSLPIPLSVADHDVIRFH